MTQKATSKAPSTAPSTLYGVPFPHFTAPYVLCRDVHHHNILAGVYNSNNTCHIHRLLHLADPDLFNPDLQWRYCTVPDLLQSVEYCTAVAMYLPFSTHLHPIVSPHPSCCFQVFALIGCIFHARGLTIKPRKLWGLQRLTPLPLPHGRSKEALYRLRH